MDNQKSELIQGFTETEIRTFIGKNADYYLDSWRFATPKTFGWNLSAYFFNLFWFGYRKMYSDMIMISLMWLVMVFIPAKVESKLTSLIFMTAALSSAGGNQYYLNFMKEKIENIESKYPKEFHEEEIMKAGGTSWWGVAVAAMLIAFYGILMLYVGEG
jgi:hypothetical protein